MKFQDESHADDGEAVLLSRSVRDMRTSLLSFLCKAIWFSEALKSAGLLYLLYATPELPDVSRNHARTLAEGDISFLRHHLHLSLVSLAFTFVALLPRWFGLETLSSTCHILGMLLQSVLAATHILASTIVLGPVSNSKGMHWIDFVSIEGGSAHMTEKQSYDDANIANLLDAHDWFRPTMLTYPVFAYGAVCSLWHAMLRSGILYSSFRKSSGRISVIIYTIVILLFILIALPLLSSCVFDAAVAMGNFFAQESSLVVSEVTLRCVIFVFRVAFFVPVVVEVVYATWLQGNLKESLLNLCNKVRAGVVNMREFMRKFSHIARTALTSILPNTKELSSKLEMLLGLTAKKRNSPVSPPAAAAATEDDDDGEPAEDVEELRSLLQTLELSGQVTARLIHELVDQYRLKMTGIVCWPTFTDLPGLLNRTVESLKEEYLNEGVTVSVDVKADVTPFPDICVDQILLARVLGNILSNAFKYTFKGKVDIIVRSLEHSKHEREVQIIVRDTGRGMGSEKLRELNPPRCAAVRARLLRDKSLFPRFARPIRARVADTRSVLSLGVGMKIVFAILREMNAILVCESVPGVGTTFLLSFFCPWRPTINPDLVFPKIVPTTRLDDRKADLRLLIAEDDLSSRKVLRRYLEILGYKEGEDFRIFNNGRLALDQLLHIPWLSRNLVILTDINMPVMNGHVFCANIRADPRLKHLPVFAMTATISTNSAGRYCKKFKLDGCLEKPYWPEDLRWLLQQAAVVAQARGKRVYLGGYSESSLGMEKKKIVVSMDEGDEVADSLGELSKEVEKRLFGQVLSDSTLEKSSLSACLFQLFVEGTAVLAMWLLIPHTVLFAWIVTGLNVFSIFGRYLFPSWLGLFVFSSCFVVSHRSLPSFEMIKLAFIINTNSILVGREVGFHAVNTLLACSSATMCQSNLEVGIWSGLGLLVMLGSELFAGPRIVSVDQMLGWATMNAIFSTLHFVQSTLDFAARHDKENSRLRSVVHSYQKHRREQMKFLRETSHDLSNAMSGLNPILVSLCKKTVGVRSFNEDLLPLYRCIHSAFRSIKSGVSQLLEYFRLKANKLCLIESEVAVHRFVSNLVEQVVMFSDKFVLGDAPESNLFVDNEIPVDLRTNIDRRRVWAILENLLNNAEKSECLSVNLTARIVTLPVGDSILEFIVEDDGIGMSAEKIRTVFADPFTGKNRQEIDPSLSGGFSLFMGKQLAQLMGGDLEISSKHVGTRVRFHCPIKTVSRKRLRLWKLGERKPLLPSRPIVVVDDCGMTRRVFGLWLRSAGFQVLVFEEVSQVRAAMRSERLVLEKCLVCLVDCSLKKQNDGVKLAFELAKVADGSPPVIPMSCDDEKLSTLRVCFPRVLLKPVGNSDDLLSFIQEVTRS